MKVALALLFLAVAVSAVRRDIGAKIEPKLQASLAKKGSANVLVSFKERTAPVLQALSNRRFASRNERLNAVHDSLTALADQSQKDAQSVLRKQKASIDFEVFWITNQIYVRNASPLLIHQLAALDSVTDISEEFEVYLDQPIFNENTPRPNGVLAEWGVENIEAPAAWEAGANGDGIIVGGIDTGVLATHVDLESNFVGVNYGWRDVTLFGTQTPRDDNGHGTHTMGTIAGQNGIGVAPGAKWMACKALNAQGGGTNAGLISCGQFMACPTLPNGNSPDCTKAPHVVSNSWGGGQANPFYNEVINAWHAAGVIPVFANGNSGPACQTANSPADSLAGVIGVGATDSSNTLASFSSKGPTVGGRQKPDISAPGAAVRSAWHTPGNNAYNTISGTSMACPHVAGVVALMKQMNSAIEYEALARIITDNADHDVNPTGSNCNNVDEGTFPNYAYGYGKINARRCAAAARK